MIDDNIERLEDTWIFYLSYTFNKNPRKPWEIYWRITRYFVKKTGRECLDNKKKTDLTKVITNK